MRKKRLKDLLCYLCIGSLLLSAPALALHAEILNPAASVAQSGISVSGEADCAKVNVEIWSSEKLLITTQAFPVADGTFSGTVNTGPLPNGTYTVKYADFEGGPYTTSTVVVYVAPPTETGNASPGSTQPATSEITPTAKVDEETGAASAAVSEKEMDAALEAAKKSGAEAIVIIPVVPEGTSDVSVTFPGVSAGAVGAEGKSITVETPDAWITIGSDGLNELAEGTEQILVRTQADENGAIIIIVKADDEMVQKVTGGISVTIPAAGLSGTMVLVLVHEDGSETVLPKSVVTEGGVTVRLEGSATIKVVNNAKQFHDVTPGSWMYEAVSFTAARELFQGTAADTFSPDGNMTRGMLATVLHRLELCPKGTGTAVFPDLDPDAWYADAAIWAYEAGIIQGVDGNLLAADRDITRAQLVTMLFRCAEYLGLDTQAAAADMSGFGDADDIPDWSAEAFGWAIAGGIVTGTDQGTLAPNANATRAQVSAVLMRMIKLLAE